MYATKPTTKRGNARPQQKADVPKGSIDVDTLPPEKVDRLLAGWSFEQNKSYDWRGFGPDGERTALKRLKVDAMNDAINGRHVCSRWPHCQHSDPDACSGRGYRGKR